LRITFPHMGNSYIAISSLLKELGLDVVVPPPCSKRTLELGIRYSPEFVCLPFKINLGNYLEAMDQGAEAILMAGGWGPCRFGYYAQVERDILQDLGREFNMVIIEAPDSKLPSLLNQVRQMGIKTSWFQVWSAIRLAWEKLKAVDRLEALQHYWLPRVADKSRCESMVDAGLKSVDGCGELREMAALVDKVDRDLSGLGRDVDNNNPIRIGLAGEIYTLLEPFANYYLERQLGRMGVEVVRDVNLTQWVNDHLFGGVLPSAPSLHTTLPLATPYLQYWVGGHGRETVASTVGYARQKLDGVIQVAPLTCMPEIVAQSVLEKVQEEEGIPVMTMYFDEHAGEVGIITRLEAFLDMIRWRKMKTGDTDAKNLSGSRRRLCQH
jgi:predicted nucleotide-binding protein (sugar kinase/HSP70/actin superfamily)